MRLRYTRPALVELDTILDYIEERSPKGAARVSTRIQAVTTLLLKYPRIGAATSDPVIRRVTATPYPYAIFYEIAGDEIVIHAIRHGARDPARS